MMAILRIFFYPVLWLLSVFYALIVSLNRNFCLKNRKILPGLTICVGNITAGGTGKTPAVILLAKYIAGKRKKAAVLSRGYKRKTRLSGRAGRDPVVVSDGNNIVEPIEAAGDEPFLMAKNLPGVPVVVCADRYAAGRLAVEKFAPDVLLMDDGFQHCRLFRDLDIVLIDCLDPFGGNHLLPLGFLREPVSSIGRAGIILLTNSNLVPEAKLETIIRRIKKHNHGAPIFKALHKPAGLEKIATGEKIALARFNGTKVTALSSIGRPESFEKTLGLLGMVVSRNIRYPDHHWYSESEVIKLPASGLPVITTEKDAVRLEKILKAGLQSGLKGHAPEMYVLKIELEIEEGKKGTFEKQLDTILKL
ncbi:MAG: tetraacyldisaccharide 4'-kinase [Elusimicrobia bacterium RIFOXYB2_FULL_48_7]|nr:MAG: tetraacyldisaccharide 4'-kinase [Elusimicrobia bacterium RIFOXYB2_FULL_48_7]